jgi:hypothetical protein
MALAGELEQALDATADYLLCRVDVHARRGGQGRQQA